jgi:hypothetical protein
MHALPPAGRYDRQPSAVKRDATAGARATLPVGGGPAARRAAPLGGGHPIYAIDTARAIWNLVDDEAVIVHTETSAYYGLNRTGTALWTLLADGARPADALARHLSASHGVPLPTATADVTAFLDHLAREGLVTAGTPAIPPGPAADAAGIPPAGYESPLLTRFGELEKLILSGE